MSVFEGCSEVLMYFSLHVPWSYDHFLHTLYSLTYIYIHTHIYDDVCFFHLDLTCVVSFLSLYTCFFLYTTCLCFTRDALMNLV